MRAFIVRMKQLSPLNSNPGDGYALFGTFDTPEEAQAWVMHNRENYDDLRYPDRVEVLCMNRVDTRKEV